MLICVVGLQLVDGAVFRTQSIDTVCLDATLVTMTFGFLVFSLSFCIVQYFS